ncbi:MAG: outer membrane lipoprotein carrier protein LolA [Bacilli bacterium]|nr:outer membrane lipoprotein carrier protein LolA [Bacilli bacterium]
MKKTLIFFSFLLILLTGCGKYTVKDAEKDLEKKIKNLKGYNLYGEMEIKNNDDVYKYDVDVIYKKSDKFRVSLKNKTNNHEQIILKNSDGVYVLTPSLNKSFKFQSDWPYNNSQVYLLQTLLSDIQNDKDKKFKSTNSNFIFTTKVNYPNNSDLVCQKIYFDKNLNPVKVEVLNEDDDVLITMNFKKADLNANFKDNKFSLDGNMKVSKDINEVKTVSKIDEEVYPMYIPKNTKLTNKETVSLDKGERVIMTFEGDKPFLLVEQTASVVPDNSTISVDGNPYQMATSVAAVSDNMVSWINNGIEYYVVGNNLSEKELISVASSIAVMPTSK